MDITWLLAFLGWLIFGIAIGAIWRDTRRTAKACERMADILRRSEEVSLFDRKREQQAKKPF